MRNNTNYIILSLLLLVVSLGASAQEIRYVTKNGRYANDGKSWANAKLNIQDAINDLVDNGLSGEVWVAAGTYTPTESTESSGGSTLYMSFKIPAGIKVYGGFAGTETDKDQRVKTNHETAGWFYANRTVLSGDLSTEPEFRWNASKKVYDTSFFGNCYHVVWFATKGFDSSGRALPLGGEALLEGCVVKDGNARNTSMTGRAHNAYGGGIYMVEGAKVENTIISHCEASRDGGAVYMDGGGILEHCYITHSQALGIGVENGYGGGVCIDSNKSSSRLGILRSSIFNCVGRMGGGLAIKVPHATGSDNSDIRFKAFASAVLVSNNTATTEAGGIYMNGGGAISQMTIVNNQCNGSGTISNGMVTGRAAGLYCRDRAYVLNSVLWGGECAANNNVQFATSRSSNNENLKVDMQYCSLSMSDYVDWSGTRKLSVSSLSTYNSAASEAAAGASSASTVGYPLFKTPVEAKGHVEISQDDFMMNYNWRVASRSSLLNSGLNTADVNNAHELPFDEINYDITSIRFNPRPTAGAYTPDPVVVAPQIDGNNVNFYVEQDADRGIEAASLGASWDTPVRFLSNVFYHIRQHQVDYAGKTINVYVKEGEVNNTNSFIDGRVRMISIDIPSGVNVYGGYPLRLTGTSLEGRNPVLYPTIITGKVTDNYDVNVAHLVKFDGSTNVVFDGFQVRYANASSTVLTNNEKNGAGMLFLNGADVKVRNTIIAGCTAEQGAAIYATGTSKVDFENCIIHNNASSTLKGIIYSEGSSQLTFDHCNILRNVGYAGYLEGTTTTQTYTNTIFFANMDRPIDNTNQEAGGGVNFALPAFAGATAGATGNYCMFDSKSAGFQSQFGGNSLGEWQYNLQYTFGGGAGAGYPRFINPTKNTGVSPDGDATFNGRATSFEPHNNNPMVNAASHSGDHTTWGTDMSSVTTRDYGGLPDIGAIENHQATRNAEGENAYTTGQPPYGGVTYIRDYNTYNLDGSVSVADNEITHANGVARDGSSWQNAINGNAVYQGNDIQISYTLATPTASTIDNPVPFKLGVLNNNTPGNPVHFAQNKSGDVMHNTTNASMADDFILIATGTEHIYYIYNLTQKKYTYYTDTNAGKDKVKLKDDNLTNARWCLYSVNAADNYKTYIIIPESLGYTQGANSWNYHGGYANNNIGLSPGYTDAYGKWQFYGKTIVSSVASLNGFQYALNNANASFRANNKEHNVWVGAGKYNARLIMREGASAFGGFPAKGNPGKDERNISNLVDEYKTIIDGNDKGRVLTQDMTFGDTTIFEGFTIRKGKTKGTDYGAGVYLQKKGVIKNCLVENNIFDANDNTEGRQGGGGVYLNPGSLVKNSIIRKNIANGNGRNIFVGGAGVFSAGGTLQNSLIVENTTNSTAFRLLGAGLFISQRSKLYNCTIAYNFGNQGGTLPATGGVWDDAAKHVGNGVYTNQSLFYNCIMWGNYANGSTMENMIQVGMSGFNYGAGKTNDAFFTCYSSAVNATYASDVSTDPNKVYITNTSATASAWQAFYNACKDNEPFVRDADGNTTYALKAEATQCINQGSEETVLLENDIVEDIVGSDRVQDCTVDKGAYEYNDSYAINPDVVSVSGQAVFYVTPEGRGTASADSPKNAACAAKLQKVLDAAGRYKYQHPSMQVIVKVADSNSLAAADTPFKYYATRTTDHRDSDVRLWSIIVPRGVEVWGGYTDTYTNADNNGFYSNSGGTYTDNRDVTGHPTYFDSYYYNKAQKNDAFTYHVITFTDKVFDGNGKPYLATDVIGQNSSYLSQDDGFMSMAAVTSDRAVVDGIYVTNGNANIQVTNSGSGTRNINQYGGAAIVTDFAHVRNCILRGNKGIYGGALALTHNALVSGCLMEQNSAEYGGAIYVFENGTQLSDGTTINMSQGSASAVDINMPRVYTSTIVNNKAVTQGGGVWFSSNESNVRINSSVIWANDSQDQANISGLYNPDKPIDDMNSSVAFYPFSYCATQNIRLSGTNNINLHSLNKGGARFAKKGATDGTTLAEENMSPDAPFKKYDDFGYYGLTNYSVLVRTGMPKADYNYLVASKKLADSDFCKLSREIATHYGRNYIDIGARAFDKTLATNQLMMRLFVANPEDIDMDAAQAMMNSGDSYYNQEGSSFAYPMQRLQDALDYIYKQREVNSGVTASEDANKLPFEICVSRGTYYPTRDIAGNYGYSVSNTFLVPEGVSIIGGFNNKEGFDSNGNVLANNFLGRGYEKDVKPQTTGVPYYIHNNVNSVANTTVTVGGYTLQQLPTETITKYRKQADINANNIIEPWEFAYQTVLSGDVDNINKDGVYHVVSVFADEKIVGALPPRSEDNSSDYIASGNGYGSVKYEEGQIVTLDGLTITGGYAKGYQEGAMDEFGKFTYYHGGGLLVNGNRYCDDFNKNTTEGTVFKHNDVYNPVGYRNIPVVIVDCKFVDNHGGYGAAISANTAVDIFNSSFERNMTEAGNDAVVPYNGTNYTVEYAGHGGAIYATYQLTAVNTIFANNEAVDTNYSLTSRVYRSLHTQSTEPTNMAPAILGGCGGAVYMGQHGMFHFLNCNFVHNQANAYPAVFTMNPNKQDRENTMTPQYNQFTNTLFWQNEVNNEMNRRHGANEYFNFASKLICNYGSPSRTGNYEPKFEAGYMPKNQTELDVANDYQETAWFCAYERNRGITQNNSQDLRDAEYTPLKHVMYQLRNVKDKNNVLIPYQNCNIVIDSENSVEEGPNFANPSPEAGYAGYVESADWSPTRLNSLTDNGSGKIKQTITSSGEQYTATFDTYSSAPVDRPYSIEDIGDYVTSGAYTTTCYLKGYHNYNKHMPLGNDNYMKSAYVNADGSQQNLYRISYDPNPTHNQTYIDIGVYEYPHTELRYSTEGDEVDVLWVSPIEKPDNGLPDGSAWSQPTSDLQRAIETLLASRNGHRKEIRLMNGTFTPIYNIDDYLAFYIDTKHLNESVILPMQGLPGFEQPVYDLGVKSFTIKGGYSRELNGVYDVEEYPAIIRQQQRTDITSDRWNHLLFIGDPTQRYGKQSYTADTGNDYGHGSTVQTMPIQIDGVTLVNNQAKTGTKGAAIFYKELDDAVTSATDISVTGLTGKKTSPAKLVISKTTIVGSGTNYEAGQNDNTSSSVFIGKNGGYSLLYNNVMHSNYGNPLEAECQTEVVNNTFAMNRGFVKMTASGSKIYNSVFWKNNPKPAPTDGYDMQFQLEGYTSDAASGSIFKRNAYTGGAVDYTDYSAGQHIANNNYNVGLSDENTDVILGPNFVDPENNNIEQRSYMLNPSLKLLNKGDNTLYNATLTDAQYNIYDMAWNPTTDKDASGSNRFINPIDVGAYEYHNSLNRVLYVNPNNATSGTGTSWATPVGFGDLQRAVDMAALYHVNNVGDEAYVFVKGASSTNANLHTGEVLTMRDGVSVYGGINPAYTTDCKFTYDAGGNVLYQSSDLKDYADSIIANRDGVAGYGASKTTVSGIQVNENTAFTANDPNITSVADGFVVTATTSANPSGLVTKPVININPRTVGSSMVLRNIIVKGNDISNVTGGNIAEVNNALIYEALFHGNKASNSGAVLKMGADGYAVNVTAEGKTIGADGTSLLNGGIESASHVFNSIVNYAGVEATEKTLSGYNYAVADKNLNYQLTEKSKHIDECSTNNPISSVANLAGFINYASDRDLLGNPRLLNNVSAQNKIDRGAFETWKIEKEAVTTKTDNYFYPHNGSVVYIMSGNNLVLGTDLNPAYLLLQNGASLYGNGKDVRLSFVGLERNVKDEGSMVSMPYKMDYNVGTQRPVYNTDGVLTLNDDASEFYAYNGQSRSAWNYVFAKSNSGTWGNALSDGDVIQSNHGVLMLPQTSGLFRFTAQNTDMSSYLYTETATQVSKSIVLTQYDDRNSTAGGADFTSKEDMGWNCFGLPYLVSNYETAAQEPHTGASHYNLDVPHTLWLYYDGQTYSDGTTNTNGDGGFYSVSSWDNSDWHLAAGEKAVIWAGEGIFTQTAAVNDTEELLFYRPVYSQGSGAKPMFKTMNSRSYTGIDIKEEGIKRNININVKGHTVRITELEGSERINIYDNAGRLVESAMAGGSQYITSLPHSGVYIVKVDNVTKKILIM